MPALHRSSKRTLKKCIICGAETLSTHLGVDACRACAVFYRRSAGKKYACRSNTHRCPVNKEYGISCKRCRFDRIERTLAQSREDEINRPESASASAHEIPYSSLRRALNDQRSCSGSSNTDAKTDLPLLSKLKTAYESMCFTRRASELNACADPPHPMLIRARNGPIFPATFATMMHGNRVLLTTILEFAASSFVEFNMLSSDEQWQLAVNFFYRFRSFESCYRAEKAFPNELNKSFGTFTTWLSEEAVEGFFDDQPNTGNIEEAKRLMGEKCGTRFAPARDAMKRVAPDEREFLALTAIMFWTTEGAHLSDEITKIAEGYRKEILHELHAYYREHLGMSEYASRVGELFGLLQNYEKAQDVREQFEILRLLDVVSEDNFTYSLQRQL